MQINSVSNGIKFGTLSHELHENMWQAVQRNCPNLENLNKSKLYRDYKYILEKTAGDDFSFDWLHDCRKNFRYTSKVIAADPSEERREHNFSHSAYLDVTDIYWNSKDPYKDIIKVFAKWLQNHK